jgi:hypothetical protein
MDDDSPTTLVYLAPRAAVKRLSEAGLVTGLDDAALDRLRAECWDGDEEQMEDAGVLGILTSFYESRERGMRDGFLWHDERFWQETDDVNAELSKIVREPIFVQRSMKSRISTARKFREEVCALTLVRDDGVVKDLEARRLADVVAAWNAELRARGRGRRVVTLDTSGEWGMYLAIEVRLARELAVEGALPISAGIGDDE